MNAAAAGWVILSLVTSGCTSVVAGVAATSNAAMLGAVAADSGVDYRSIQQNFVEERGVDVALTPYNWREARDPKYFSIAVDFTSDLKNPRRIEADFRQFALTLPDGAVVKPIGFALTYPDAISQGCRSGGGKDSLPPFKLRAPLDIRAFPPAPIRVRSNAWSIASECFDVIFPVATVPPKLAFSVDVAGILIDGAPMHPERVRFVQGTR
jgi:hypothetical protein